MGRVVQFPLTLILTSCAAVLALVVLSLMIVGTFGGLFKELFGYYSSILNIGLSEFKTKTTDTNRMEREARKIFDLPISEDARGRGMVYVRDK